MPNQEPRPPQPLLRTPPDDPMLDPQHQVEVGEASSSEPQFQPIEEFGPQPEPSKKKPEVEPEPSRPRTPFSSAEISNFCLRNTVTGLVMRGELKSEDEVSQFSQVWERVVPGTFESLGIGSALAEYGIAKRGGDVGKPLPAWVRLIGGGLGLALGVAMGVKVVKDAREKTLEVA